ncbi:outer membrane efflux protein [Erwinia sp. JUb26]|nr:outer membrane efflux protein [Erwinia sp. JUb26]
MMLKTLSMGLLPILILAGCTMEPDYQRPSLPVSGQYAEQGPHLAGNGADIRWQHFFTDPVMHQLIVQALDNNRDLRIAALNVDVARSQVTVARSALMPSVDLNAGETAAHLPGNLYNTGPGGGGPTISLMQTSASPRGSWTFLAACAASATARWSAIWQWMPLSAQRASA